MIVGVLDISGLIKKCKLTKGGIVKEILIIACIFAMAHVLEFTAYQFYVCNILSLIMIKIK